MQEGKQLNMENEWMQKSKAALQKGRITNI